MIMFAFRHFNTGGSLSSEGVRKCCWRGMQCYFLFFFYFIFYFLFSILIFYLYFLLFIFYFLFFIFYFYFLSLFYIYIFYFLFYSIFYFYLYLYLHYFSCFIQSFCGNCHQKEISNISKCHESYHVLIVLFHWFGIVVLFY